MSLVSSLPSSLTRSLGAGTLAPTLGLPWEDAGGGTSATALLQTLVASLGGWWWDGRTGIVLATGVSSWTDRVGGKVISQGTGANQPSYSGGLLTFDGANDSLVGAANLLSGATQCTYYYIGGVTGGNPQFIMDYGPTGARAGMNIDLGNRMSVYGWNGVAANEWSQGSATPYSAAVYMGAVKCTDGVTAAKQTQTNGADNGGSRVGVADISALTLGAGTLAFGARAFDGSFPGALTMRAGIVVPTMLYGTAANTQIVALCRTIYGV